jgi:hypothetical protein
MLKDWIHIKCTKDTNQFVNRIVVVMTYNKYFNKYKHDKFFAYLPETLIYSQRGGGEYVRLFYPFLSPSEYNFPCIMTYDQLCFLKDELLMRVAHQDECDKLIQGVTKYEMKLGPFEKKEALEILQSNK